MAYRDEREALRARLQRAEAELSEAQSTIRRLRGGGASQSLEGGIDRVTGVSRALHLERELPLQLTDEGLLEITEMLARKMPGGSVQQVGPKLIYRWGRYVLRLDRSADLTHVTLTGGALSGLGALLLGAPGLALIGAILAAALVGTITRGDKLAMTLAAVAGVIAATAGLRSLVRRAAMKERALLTSTFEVVLDLATAHAPPARRARVALDAEPSNEQARETEALDRPSEGSDMYEIEEDVAQVAAVAVEREPL